MEEWYGYKRFLIIDLDAHQGNGHERDHMDKSKFFIIDAYHHGIYPADAYAKKAISLDLNVGRRMSDSDYMGLVERSLQTAFAEF